MPPSLSLLIESKPGCAMHEIGTLIYMKMHDINWEVRDSALELLYVCTEIAYVSE
jgi:BRCA1-associated ATM activator 1